MSSLFTDRDDSEDLFANTRMSFGDHIEELRWHLIRAILGAGVIVIGVFVLDAIGYFTNLPIGAGKPLMEFIARPVEIELMKFYTARIQRVTAKLLRERQQMDEAGQQLPEVTVEFDRTGFRQQVGLPAEEGGAPRTVRVPMRINPAEVASITAPSNVQLLHPPLLATLSITEGFMVYIKVSVVLAVVIASPWIFYQLWAFVAAGLYPTERRWAYVYGPFSLGLFLAGVVLCEWIVIPAAVHYLLGFNEWLDWGPELRLTEWLTFALLTPLVFGIAFQTPLVILFLHKLGIMDVSAFQKHRRYALFALALVAALLAASPDAFSMLALYIPLAGLYELGILLCRFSPKTVFDDVGESEETVEV